MTDLADEISGLFLLNGYTWVFSGEHKIPSAEDIQQALDRAVEVLYDEEPETQLEVGRMIVKKRSNTLHDVFILAGTIGEEDD